MKLRRLAASVAAVTALSGLSIAAAPANAIAPKPGLSLSSSTVRVHTSNGMGWTFGLNASSGPFFGNTLTLQINHVATSGTESHYWQLPIPASALTFNKATQRGTLKTPQSTAPLTTVSMTFKATGHRNMPCSIGSETDYTGNLSGRATLITHLKGGGTIGGQHLTFKAGTSHLLVSNNCSPVVHPSTRCTNSSFYDVSDAHNRSLFGFAGGATRSIELSHQVHLAHPAGATRTDYASARSSSAPTLNKKTKTLRVFGSTSGLVTGTGKIVAKTITHSSGPCTLNGKHHTQDQWSSGTAKFTNTTGHAIVGRTRLTGRLTIANGASGFFDYETWH